MSDSDSDIPDLEPVEGETQDISPESLLIDFRSLNQGDPSCPGKGLSRWAGVDQASAQGLDSARAFELARSLRAEAMEIYSSKPNTAVLKMTDAIILCPNSAIMLCSRARIFYELGEISAAVRDLEVAKARNGEHAPSRLLLAKCYDLMCDYDKAVLECRAAQALDYTDEGRNLLMSVEKKISDARAEREEEERQAREAAASARPAVEDVTPGAAAESGPGVSGKGSTSFKEQLYAEIGDIKQKHGAAALPPAFRVLDNLETEAKHLSAGTAEKLMKDEKVMKAFADPEFQRKLDEMGRDPAKAAKYMKDKDFMEGFQAVLRCMQ